MLKSKQTRTKRNKKRNYSRCSMFWCICILLLFIASVSPSLRQKITNHPAHNSKSLSVEQNQVSFRYPYLVAAKVRNKEVHVRNGNQANRGKSISICYWNKGSSYLINKKEDIKEIINTHKPLVLGLGTRVSVLFICPTG